MLIYDVILDVGTTGCQQSVSLYQGDDRFKLLRITLLQNGSAFAAAADLSVRLHGVKPDDSVLSAKCGVRGGSVYYLPSADATDTPGSVRCQLQIRDHAGAILFSPEFSMEIAETVPVPELPEGASEDAEYNAEVLSELTASADGETLLFRGKPVGAIPSVNALPQSAADDAIFYRIGEGLYRFADDTWQRLTNDGLADALAALQANGHTHENKNTLDGVTAAKVTSWDAAAADSHTHANASVLDTVTSAVVSNSHTHGNRNTLDTITPSKVSNWDAAAGNTHAHTNKSTLDAVTSVKVSNWDTAVSSKHTHANKSVLDGITAAKITGWDAAAGDSHAHANAAVLDTVTSAVVSGSHTHENKSTLDGVTAAKVAGWDAAAADSHTHANAAVLDTVTSAVVSGSHTHENKDTLDRIDSLKIAQWDAVRAEVALLQMDAHSHTNRSVLNAITAAKVTGWDAAAQDRHTHANAESLEKVHVVPSYASLSPSGTNGSVGFVTGFDAATKPLQQYDAQTDAAAPLTLAGEITYNASAQTDVSALVVQASGDDVGIVFLPVYTQAQAQNNPSFGALGMALVTQGNDPLRYMIGVGCDSILESDLLDDLCVSLSSEAEIEIFLVYAFEDVEGVMTAADGAIGDTLSFLQGWNVFYVIAEDEDVTVNAAHLLDPNVYCDYGSVDQIQGSASQQAVLYDALRLGVRTDKRGVYVRTGGQWNPLYDAQLQALNDRVSALESSAQA